MYIRTSELRKLDVVNIEDGRILGNVCDIDVDPDTGCLRGLVVDLPGSGFWFFRRYEDVEIAWSDVILIGVDVVLVKVPAHKSSQHRPWQR